MAMKNFLKISALIVVLTLALTLSLGIICYSADVAYADNEVLYAYAAPSDLAANETAGASRVAVYDQYDGTVMFYLIESYYYPVKTLFYTTDLVGLGIDGLNGNIKLEELPSAPATNSAVSAENALPSAINTVGNIAIDGTIINSAEGWTVKPIGILGDDFFVQAMKDSTTVFGLAPKTSFTETTIKYHPIAQAERNALIAEAPANDDNSNATVDAPAKTSTALRVVLIIGIAIPAVIIAILLFKPNRNERGYDDKREMRRRERDSVDYDRDREYREREDYDRRPDYDREYRERGRRDDDYDRDRYDRNRDRDYDRDRNRDYDGNRGYGRDYDDRGRYDR